MLAIARENPNQPDVLALLHESDAFSAARYPPESQHLIDPAALSRPDVRFLVARRSGRAVGCGALVLTGDCSAELKRMIVAETARGQGVGRTILEQLEATARREHVRIIHLETGIYNDAALRTYRAAGYRACGPFGTYAVDPLSVFLQKELTP
jgi:putative acetyltransferase